MIIAHAGDDASADFNLVWIQRFANLPEWSRAEIV